MILHGTDVVAAQCRPRKVALVDREHGGSDVGLVDHPSRNSLQRFHLSLANDPGRPALDNQFHDSFAGFDLLLHLYGGRRLIGIARLYTFTSDR